MKADISRDTFQAARDIRRVIAQQGRPWVDADWNEQVSVLLYRLETLAADCFGEHKAIDDGFAIEGSDKLFNFAVRRGRYYLHGLMCENHQPAEIVLKTRDTKPYFVYLHAWEQYESSIEDSAIVEPALNGVETCGRTVVRWAVECTETAGIGTQWKDFRKAQKLESLPATLKVKAKNAVDGGGARRPGRSSFLGMTNVLYRVELHVDKEGASFKWAPNNASALTAVSSDGATLTCRGAGDLDAAFQPDGWVEMHEDSRSGEEALSGTLRRIGVIDREARTIGVVGGAPSGDALFARPWAGSEAIRNGFQPLGAALEISFSSDPGRPPRAGQHWLIAMRTNGGGQVYRPKENDRVYEWVALDDPELGKIGVAARESDASAHRSNTDDTPTILYRRRHYYGPLAVIQFDQEGKLDPKNIQDRRNDPKQR